MYQLLQKLSNKFNALIENKFLSFDDVASLKDTMGVYMIYDHKKELLYIGQTNKFHIRFGVDLKHEATHTLVKKMIKSQTFVHRHEVVQYLKNECFIKIEICESKREAEALEHIAIYILNPPWNK